MKKSLRRFTFVAIAASFFMFATPQVADARPFWGQTVDIMTFAGETCIRVNKYRFWIKVSNDVWECG